MTSENVHQAEQITGRPFLYMQIAAIFLTNIIFLLTAPLFSMEIVLDKTTLNTELLQRAELGDDPEKVTLLIKLGADVNVHDNKWRTPLLIATKAGHIHTMKALLDAGANIATTDTLGWTLLDFIFRTKNSSVAALQLLIEYGIDKEALNSRGTTVAIRAIDSLRTEDDEQKIEALLKSKIDTTVRDGEGNTLLHLAAKSGRSQTIVNLLTYGLGVNERNRKLETPLHKISFSATYMHETITTLIQAGADRFAVCIRGKKPLDVAYEMYEKHRSFESITSASIQTFIITITHQDIQHIIPALIVLTGEKRYPDKKPFPKEICKLIGKQLIPAIIEERLALAKKYILHFDKPAKDRTIFLEYLSEFTREKIVKKIEDNIKITIKKLPKIGSIKDSLKV